LTGILQKQTLSEIKDYSNNKEFREYLFLNKIHNTLKTIDKFDIYFEFVK
tara:strand:- start:597 stop:746 length:150 start_codon:yes stop_codon:yes gene_type:complete